MRLHLVALLSAVVVGIAGGEESSSIEWIEYEDCCACEACSMSGDGQGACSANPFSNKLTGDWFGARSTLAGSGITFNADLTQFYFGVASGGAEREFRYAGHGDYVVNLDAEKMGLGKGLFVKLRAEHRFGESLAGATGAILPSNVLADLPVADSDQVFLTDVLFTQFLTPRFAFFAGKLNTLDGDLNAFAHRRGKEQFSNIGFVSAPIALRTVPYSTLGAGFVILGEGAEPIFTFTVLNPTDTTKSSGFDELFADGVTLIPELRLPTRFFGRPGHQLIGGTWSSREYVSLDQDPRIILPSVPIARSQGSWSVYYNFDQYLHVDPCDPTRGWGLFGRAGIADGATNPIEWFLSLGVGGNSPLRGRQADRFGAGWFLAGTSDEIDRVLEIALGPIGNGQAVELFYNAEVTPWCHVTPDLQVVIPSREDFDPALVLGVRAVVDF